jgi:para-nitrobenzyl esterase
MDEGNFGSFFGNEKPTIENYIAHTDMLFDENAKTFLKLYPALTDSQVKRAAQDFAGDKFIAYSTWKWVDMQFKTGESPVFRYEFDQTLPLPTDAKPGTEPRAAHAWEIEYVFRVLSSKNLPWTPEDYQVSELISSYWTNFAKTGDPNGPGLPLWPAYDKEGGYQVMHLKANPESAPDGHRGRYEFLEKFGFGE